MNKDIEKQLENYKYDKQSIPVLVYKVENIELKGNRYFKIFLVNNSKVYDTLEIAFKINNYTYSVSSFSIIKEHKDPNIFGCVIKLEDDYKGVDYDILYELKDGKKFIPTTPKKVETPKEEVKEEPIKARNFETKIEKKEEKPKKNKKKSKSNKKSIITFAVIGIIVIIGIIYVFGLPKGEKEQQIEEQSNSDINNLEIVEEQSEFDIAVSELEKGINVKQNYELLFTNNYQETVVDKYINKYLESLEIGDTMYFGLPNNINQWTVLDIEENSILILNEDTFVDMKYSDNNSNKWNTSLIHDFLEEYWGNNFTEHEKQLIKETQLDSASNHLFILNEHEFNKYRDIIPIDNSSWWLRPIKEYDEHSLSMGSSAAYTTTSFVEADTKEGKNYSSTEKYGYGGVIWVEFEKQVKPAMWISID